MELVKIEKLLEKYFAAETTVAEEQQLKSYFMQDDVAPHLQEYRYMFAYFSESGQERYTRTVPQKPGRKKYLAWLSVAAVALVAVTLWVKTPFQTNDLGTYDDPEVAFEETQKALEFIAANLNKGTEEIKYLKAFEETKNKIFKE